MISNASVNISNHQKRREVPNLVERHVAWFKGNVARGFQEISTNVSNIIYISFINEHNNQTAAKDNHSLPWFERFNAPKCDRFPCFPMVSRGAFPWFFQWFPLVSRAFPNDSAAAPASAGASVTLSRAPGAGEASEPPDG